MLAACAFCADMRAILFAISHITVSRLGKARASRRPLFEFPSEFSTSALKRERKNRAIPTQPLEERQSECELWWGAKLWPNKTDIQRGGKCNSRKARRRTVVSSSKLSDHTSINMFSSPASTHMTISRYLCIQEWNVHERRSIRLKDNPHTKPRFFSGLRKGEGSALHSLSYNHKHY